MRSRDVIPYQRFISFVRSMRLLSLAVILVLILFTGAHYRAEAAPPVSCGTCTSEFRPECEAKCTASKKAEKVFACTKGCVKKKCATSCACRDCKKAAAKSCKERCANDKGKPKNVGCLSECLRAGCQKECGAPVPESERPPAQW